MTIQFKTRIVAILFVCCILMVSMLFYFMLIFDDKTFQKDIINSSKPIILVGFAEINKQNLTLKDLFERKIKTKQSQLELQQSLHTDSKSNDYVQNYLYSLKTDLKLDENDEQLKQLKKVWLLAKKWVRARQIVPEKAPGLANILQALQNARIIKSDVSRKGTQLKLLLTLEDGQLALFKPKRYERDYETKDIYSGADRHNGEIVAFHLSRILNLRYAPIVASRLINVSKEIRPTATEPLLATFVNQTNDPQQCFYGECYYCNEYDLVCPDQNGMLEGAMILMIPNQYQLQKLRHPWQRTYKKQLKAQWELDEHYCFSVMKSNPLRPRVLDLVDVAIFDYLIGNADRHHYEVFKDVSNSAILLIDNGKSFGQPDHDEMTILFPLVQCCVLRNSTYQHLKQLMRSTWKLSKMLEQLLQNDQLWPLINQQHLHALDRRLSWVMASIEICFDQFHSNYVLKN